VHWSTVTDSDGTFTGLPSGKTVRMKIISANDAGEGPASNVVKITVP
jgi:hypothetical protein